MTASRNATDPLYAQCTTTPIIDYEPVPQPLGRPAEPTRPCPAPPAAVLHRLAQHSVRAHRPPLHLCEVPPPRSAVAFAEAALRQVIEVIDRRRPIAQLRPLMTPALVDRVLAHAGSERRGSATLRTVRVRAVHQASRTDGADNQADGADIQAAEVFASFTRSGRVHAVAARIERYRDRWRLVALQIG
jgi:hypothetical protein